MKTYILDDSEAATEPTITITPAAAAVQPVRGDLSEGEHTPGKWFARYNDNHLTVETESAGLRSVIARCNVIDLCEEHGGTAGANAQLIARAPELLAENARLRDCLKWFVNCTDDDAHPGDMPHARSRAIAALAGNGGGM